MPATISVKNLKKYFGATKAVDGISFDVQKGEIMGFLGPNGAGKTTAIRCMMDFLNVDEGEISILGKDAHRNSAALKNDIGFLSGEVDLYENWSGRDHIQLVKQIRKVKTYENELIDTLEYDPSKRIRNLSTGNKQKLGLILALMHKPKVLILDEPTTGLDPLLQQSIYTVLQSHAEDGASIFMSSHNLAEVERLCDRVCIIRKGKIVNIEKMNELRKKRLYSVRVFFEKKIDDKKLTSANAEIKSRFDHGVVLSVKGDIKPLLQTLSKLEMKDIEITHSNLEDVFLEFYK